jgi:hypothetical protein
MNCLNELLRWLPCSSYLLQSQTAVSQELENKYWTYRDRFRNYFTKVGYEAGESQTAASVYEISAKSLNYRRVNGVEVSTTGPNTYAMGVDYGDAIIDQGWYIMALASEYWLLKNKNQIETDAFKAVCNELYFYIHAIERLDGNADRIFDRSSPVSLNGFFVRSDHQTDYLKQLNTYNVPYNPIEWVKSGGFAGPEFSMIDSSNGIRVYDRDSFRINIQAGISNSDHNTWWQGGPGQFGAHQNWGNEMSQDQLYGILMGFKAVMNWVDSSLYVDPDGALSRFANKNLHQWIKDITHRIMQHVSKTHEGLFGLADQDDLKDKADSICAEITSKPYYRSDTLWLTTPDTFIFILSDTMVDTMIFTFYVRDTVSSTWFPGSSIRTCDVWQELETLKAGNYLFKEGNYVLTNPVNNDNLVTRGAVATALAYPLKLLGESITGQTYPDPYLKLRNNYSFYRWAINAYYLAMYSTGNAGTAKAIDNAALLGAISYLTLFDSKNINADKTLIQVKLGCPEVPKFSVDAMTLCVLQHPLNFQNIDFYEALWKRIPKSNILLAAFEDGLPLNMQDVYFENCLTAIHNRGGRLRYKDGNIRAVSLGGAYMDLRNGIYGEGTQGASMLENVELSARHFPNPVYHPLGAMEQTHNLKVHGAGNYYFYKSKIQFADYGSKMDQAGLLPVCTEIFDNTTQLQHTTWSKFVAVNQAWNHIHWPTSPAPTNPKKMYFGYMSYLYLDKGQNQIMGYTGGMPYLQALVATDQNLTISTDPLQWNTSAINATQNQWQTTPETQPSVNYNAIVEHGFPVANTIDINKLPLNTSNWQSTQANYCMNLKTPFSPVLGDGETESDTGIYGNGVGNGERRMPVSPADLGTMLSQHGHNGAAYVQSLRRVLRAMDMRPPNYGAIIDTFRQLLTQPLPDTVSAAVKHVYGLLQDFYLEVRTDKFIPEQDRLAQEQMVFAKMLALQQQLLVLSTDTNSIWHTPRF